MKASGWEGLPHRVLGLYGREMWGRAGLSGAAGAPGDHTLRITS
jgi:hypothetical protein